MLNPFTLQQSDAALAGLQAVSAKGATLYGGRYKVFQADASVSGPLFHLPAGDVTALLANLRYRLEPRFTAIDMALQWDVDLLEPLTQLDLKAMRQLQFMVYEAISNVLQHAHAHRLRIELRSVARGRACLRIIDDGQGFDPDRQRRRGLSSLGERAAAIAADLSITSTPGKTVVEILLG